MKYIYFKRFNYIYKMFRKIIFKLMNAKFFIFEKNNKY